MTTATPRGVSCQSRGSSGSLLQVLLEASDLLVDPESSSLLRIDLGEQALDDGRRAEVQVRQPPRIVVDRLSQSVHVDVMLDGCTDLEACDSREPRERDGYDHRLHVKRRLSPLDCQGEVRRLAVVLDAMG